MRSSSNRLLLLFTFCIAYGFSASVMAQERSEIVLLIDTSGSMKQNDPKNLRIPAANLLINLLKNRAKLTIFTFSTTTELLLPTQDVSDEYMAQFHHKQNQINSLGQFTNILAALDAANHSWQDSKSRFIVLLTDGKIDRGSAQQDNEDKKIINTYLLPDLKKNNIKLYTIGLGTDIDEELLKSLASQTNGIYQFINSMSDAEKALYNAFTSTIPAQGIPLEKASDKERKIPVDSSVTQLSVIIEKKEQTIPIVLYKPDGSIYDASKLPHLNQFIFIDIHHPTVGVWKLKGDEQQIERAIILTNLELATNKLSGEYFNRELIPITATLKLAQGNQGLSQLLTNTEIRLDLKNEKEHFSTSIPLSKEMLFQKEVLLDMAPGLTKSTITAKNDSFMREEQSLFKIMPTPFQQNITNDSLKIELTNPQIIRDSVQVKLTNQERSLSLSLSRTEGSWQASIDNLCNLQQLPAFAIQAEITAKALSGRSLTIVLPQANIVCHTPPMQMSSYIAPMPLNKIAASTSEQNFKKIKRVEERHLTPSITRLSMLSLLLLIFVSLTSGILYKKSQRLYQEKIDELRGNDDI